MTGEILPPERLSDDVLENPFVKDPFGPPDWTTGITPLAGFNTDTVEFTGPIVGDRPDVTEWEEFLDSLYPNDAWRDIPQWILENMFKDWQGGKETEYYPGTNYNTEYYDLYDYQNLPEGYVLSDDNSVVIGPDGTEYPVYYGMYGGRVYIPKPDPNQEKEDGGGATNNDGGSDSGGGSNSGGGFDPNTDGDGQYEVIGQTEDGKWIVYDREDGDWWIVEGDFTQGQVLTTDDMVNGNATVAGTDFIPPDTNTDNTEDGDSCWVNGQPGEIKNGVCVPYKKPTTNTTFPPIQPPVITPPNPKPGDACTIGGQRGVLNEKLECEVKTDVVVPPTNQGNPDLSGKPCTLPNGDAGVTDKDGACQATGGTTPGGQACTMPDGSPGTTDENGVCQSNGPGTKPGDACTTEDGQSGTIGEDGVTCEVGPGKGGQPCLLPDGTVGVTDENGVCKGLGNGGGNGNGDGTGDGDGDGDGDGNGLGMLTGGGTLTTTQWRPQRPAFVFKPAPRYQSTVTPRLFAELWNKGS